MRKGLVFLCVLVSASMVSAHEYHVAKTGKDSNKGTRNAPFLTIQRAADLARPGDIVTVHEGVYRERVNPPRGGTSDKKRITYQAADGDKVIIKGSEVVKGWQHVKGNVWKVVLPNTFFGKFNPYSDDELIGGEWYRTPTGGYDRHPGAVYLNGHWLSEARDLEQLLTESEQDRNIPADVKSQVLGGMTVDYNTNDVAGTDEDRVYQSCRFNLVGYKIAAPNGKYKVTLKFCDPAFDEKGERVFDVKLQGKTVLEKFDIISKVAKFEAHDEVFEDIEVADNLLEIDFINRVSLGCISGIVIENDKYSKKINCGGPDWKSYISDSFEGSLPTRDYGPLWKSVVDDKKTIIWAQFEGVNPNEEIVEINVRQSIFYPSKAGINYITVRGFTMRQAATPWSGAMSEQIGLIGTHWSKGWIIEDNIISHSMNTGITLGRYDVGDHVYEWPYETAQIFVESVELALEHGWSKENIGSHIVRNNHISHCAKNGIHGSLGGIFSIIEGNTICDIATQGWLAGADCAGIKLLGSQDTIIRGNHIYRCGRFGGIWLDWMAQGTRVTGNLLHDNTLQDIYMEVNHGPYLIDNNILLSNRSVWDHSQGGAFVHNLCTGSIEPIPIFDREMPYHKEHSTEIIGLKVVEGGDNRFYNNIFAGPINIALYDKSQLMQVSGNVYLGGATPGIHDRLALLSNINPDIKLVEENGSLFLNVNLDDLIQKKFTTPVNTELLGTARLPQQMFTNPDGSKLVIDRDYFGKKRDMQNPSAGPFEVPGIGRVKLKVWPNN